MRWTAEVRFTVEGVRRRIRKSDVDGFGRRLRGRQMGFPAARKMEG